MAQERPAASDSEITAFLAKLGQYRETLSPTEQGLLDDLVGSALGEGEGDDSVQGYLWAGSWGGRKPRTWPSPKGPVRPLGRK